MQKIKYSAGAIAQVFKRTCGVIGIGATLAATSQSAFSACTYTVDNEWSNGFVGTITITNTTSAPISNWSVNWQYASNRVTSGWNANLSGSNPYTASNLSWNGNIAVGRSVS